ncbi:hypothetical protein ACS0PU_007846 [Formica fusca]
MYRYVTNLIQNEKRNIDIELIKPIVYHCVQLLICNIAISLILTVMLRGYDTSNKSTTIKQLKENAKQHWIEIISHHYLNLLNMEKNFVYRNNFNAKFYDTYVTLMAEWGN